MGKVGSVGCVGSLVEGTGACVLVDEAGLVFLVGRTTSGGVFGGICDLIMILGSLSANGWGCVPVLLVVWLVVEWNWVLVLRWRSPVELLPFDITWSREVSLPTQRLRPDTWLAHQNPVSHTAQKKWEKKERKREREGFPGGAAVENLPADAGDKGSSPGLGRSHMPGVTGPVSHNC